MQIIMDLVIYGYIFIYIIQLSATCSGTKTMKRAVHFDDSFMSHDDSVFSLDSTSDAEYFPTLQKGHHLASINNLIGSVKASEHKFIPRLKTSHQVPLATIKRNRYKLVWAP